MNLPGSSAPVSRLSGRRVLSVLRVTDVEVQPAFELTPASDQLCFESLLRPINSLLRRPVSHVWRNLKHDLFFLRRTFPVRNQDVNVATTEAEAVCGFRPCICHIYNLALNSARLAPSTIEPGRHRAELTPQM